MEGRQVCVREAGLPAEAPGVGGVTHIHMYDIIVAHSIAWLAGSLRLWRVLQRKSHTVNRMANRSLPGAVRLAVHGGGDRLLPCHNIMGSH